jgi:NADH:ubiquinone oxidoreductase subunit F (NADH-binding)
MNLSFSNDEFLINNDKLKFSPKGAEYLSGVQYRDSLIKVKLVGEVQKPGVHIVPTKTTFSSLLSYAGGPTDKANIKKIILKRKTKKGIRNINLNFEQYMQSNKKDVTLKSNDLIYVTKEKPFITDRTLSIISTTLGIIVSGMVISDRF